MFYFHPLILHLCLLSFIFNVASGGSDYTSVGDTLEGSGGNFSVPAPEFIEHLLGIKKVNPN